MLVEIGKCRFFYGDYQPNEKRKEKSEMGVRKKKLK